jgi:prepilin-type N-terminal cleavage/methylation domain-containing protein
MYVLKLELFQSIPPANKEGTMRKNGFTLIEILTVALIIAGLVGTITIIIPKMKERQRQEEAKAAAVNESNAPEKAKEALKKVSTKNGHSYVPVDRGGTPAENSALLLRVMADFEENHSGFELYDVDVDFQQSAYTTNAYVYGVWFHYHINAESNTYDGK